MIRNFNEFGVVYLCILLLSWLGAQMIVSQTGLTTGELTSLLSYVMNILMSLMMLSMVFVMVTQSMAAAQRVCEVLDEKTDVASPEGGLTHVADGSIDFEHVSFSYRRSGGRPVLSDVSLHIDTGIALSTTEGYVKKLGILSRSGLLCCPPFCTEKGGDSANPVGDYYYINASAGNTVLLRGGRANYGVSAGAFCGIWDAAASYSIWYFAARPRLKNP